MFMWLASQMYKWPDVLHGKNLNTGYYLQNFLPSVFLFAMLIGTIDF